METVKELKCFVECFFENIRGAVGPCEFVEPGSERNLTTRILALGNASKKHFQIVCCHESQQ